MEEEKGMGMKVSDYWTVPLCGACHRTFHDTGGLIGTSTERTKILFYKTQAKLLAQWLEVF
jgi:hypothetical protein